MSTGVSVQQAPCRGETKSKAAAVGKGQAQPPAHACSSAKKAKLRSA